MTISPHSTDTRQKQKLTPDIELTLNHSVEICSERLESLPDLQPNLQAEVGLIAHEGRWPVSITQEYGHPYSVNYFKMRFEGHLRRTDNGKTLLIGTLIPDTATYITRGLWLMVFGPPLILLALRMGARIPLMWLIAIAAIGGLLYMLAAHPEITLRKRRQELIEDIESLMR